MHRKGRNPSLFSWSLLFTETSGFIRDGWGRIPLLRRSLHVREVEGNSQTQSNLSTCNLLFQPLWETKTQRRCQKYEWNFWQTYISPPTTGIKVKLLQFWVFFGGGGGGGGGHPFLHQHLAIPSQCGGTMHHHGFSASSRVR